MKLNKVMRYYNLRKKAHTKDDKILKVFIELFAKIKYSKLKLMLMIIFMISGTLASIYFSVLIGNITQLVADNHTIDLLYYTIIFLSVVVVQVGSTFLQARIQGSYSAYTRLQVSNFTFKQLVGSKATWMEQQKSGDIMLKMGEAMDSGISLLTDCSIQVLTIILSVALMMLYLFINNWLLALLYFSLYPIIFIWQTHTSKLIKRVTDVRLEASGKANNTAVDTMRNLTTVKAYQLEDTMSEIFETRNKVVKRTFYKFTFSKSLVGFIVSVLSLIPEIAVFVGAYFMIISNNLKFGSFLSFVLVMFSTSWPIWNFGQSMINLRGTAAGAQKMLEIWRAPQEDHSRPFTTLNFDSDQISFRNVSFSYADDHPIIKNITFSVKKGEHLAIVGESGCGKSTISKLIGGLYEGYTGDIEVFGKDIRELNPLQLRENIAFATQNSDLFPVSIAENIRWAKENMTDSQIVEKCQSAGVSSFIDTLPEKYNTLAGERGMQLSGGQKQRIAIARALSRDAKIIIFDEATSALDNTTEHEIQNELETLLKGKTVITIAHRLSSLRNVDRIIVIKDGEIVESGTKDEIVEKRGFYYALYQKQM
jgi:ABC-type multidrug transport system fused ATPase/permease subunit